MINQLLFSGRHLRTLRVMIEVEQDQFKDDYKCLWFNALSGKSKIDEEELKNCVKYLSYEGKWSDAKIKMLCERVNYKAERDSKNLWTYIDLN